MSETLYKRIFDHIKSSVVITRRNEIIDSNLAFLELFRVEVKEELFGDPYVKSIISKSIDSGKAVLFESVVNRNGDAKLVEIVVSLMNEEDQVYILEFKPIADESLYKEITILSSYSRELFDNSPDSIVIVDNDNRIIDANSTFAKMFGFNRHEAIGRDIDELVVSEEDRSIAKEISMRVLNREKVELQAKRVTKSQGLLDVLIISYPVVIDNRISGSYVIYRDMSSEKEKEKLLKEKDEFLQQLFNRSLYPIAILDIEENILDVNEEFAKLFEYTREGCLSKNINELIIPAGYFEESQRFKGKILRRESMMTETKRRTRTGKLIDVEAVGRPVIINDRVVGMFAMYRDRRVEVQALERLERQKAYFKQLFANSPDAIAMLDGKDTVVDVNSSFENLFGYSLAEVQGVCMDDLIVSKEFKEEAREYNQCVVGNGQIVKAETVRVKKDGTPVEVEILSYPIYLKENQLGVYAIYTDITERKDREREIKRLLDTDTLTGLFNRRYIYECLAERVQVGGLAILYFDLDDFKKVNDELGHKAGDELLRQVAERLKNGYGNIIEFARIGGDEFLAVLGQHCNRTLEEYVEEIQSLLGEEYHIDGKDVYCDMSVGYAKYPEDGIGVDELVATADYRMYEEKKRKRILRNPIRKGPILGKEE